MDLLKNEYVGTKELTMVKNYLMGTFMNMMDGPMNVSSFAKSMILSGKKPIDFLDFTDEMVDMSSEKILKTAQIYLNMEDIIEVIVSPY